MIEFYKYDWYAASVRADHWDVLRAVEEISFSEGEKARPQRNFQHAVRFPALDDLRVSWGGNRYPHVDQSGPSSAHLVEILRSLPWPHTVARCDVAFDTFEPYQELRSSINGVCPDNVKRLEILGNLDRDGLPRGRTFYWGGASSSARVRLYEKGFELQSKGVSESDAPSNWVRVELQARPAGMVKSALAKCDPIGVFGVAKWTSSIPLILSGFRPESIRQPRVGSSDERAFQHMLGQYGPTMHRLSARFGTRAVLKLIYDQIGLVSCPSCGSVLD